MLDLLHTIVLFVAILVTGYTLLMIRLANNNDSSPRTAFDFCVVTAIIWALFYYLTII